MVKALTTTLGDDPQLLSPGAAVRQFLLTDVLAAGANTSALATVANLAALSALDASALPEGALAYVQTVGALWTLHPPSFSSTPVDGITVVAASNGGRWFRTVTTIAESAQLQAQWMIASTGSDQNAGTPEAPLLTFSEIARRMGTWEPTLNQDTTITVADTVQPGDVYQFRPSGSGSLSVLCNPTQIFTGALSTVVGKNVNIGQPLQANQWTGATVGQLVVNVTRGNSVAGVLAVNAGVVTFSQPLTPAPIPPASNVPSEVDTWANGDTIRVFVCPDVRVFRHGFRLTNFSANLSAWIYRANVQAPNAFEPAFIEDGGNLIECSMSAAASLSASPAVGTTFRCVFPAAAGGGAYIGGNAASRFYTFHGGALGASSSVIGADLRSGCVCVSGVNLLTGGNINDVRVATGASLICQGLPTQLQALIWGQGTFGVQATTVRQVGSTAVAQIKVSTITLSNLSIGWATASSGGVITWSGPRALTAVNLDATVAGGGFTDATAYSGSGFTAQNGRATLTNISI